MTGRVTSPHTSSLHRQGQREEVPRSFKEGNKTGSLQVESSQWAEWGKLEEREKDKEKKKPSKGLEGGTLSTAHWGDQAKRVSFFNSSLTCFYLDYLEPGNERRKRKKRKFPVAIKLPAIRLHCVRVIAPALLLVPGKGPPV